MKAQRVFFALGLIVAAFVGAMILARRAGARPERLPFVADAPGDTILYVAIPDHAAFADSVAGSVAWKKLGLEPLLDQYRKARPTLAASTGPSMAFFVRRSGGWAAFFHPLLRPETPSGQVGELFWFHHDGVLSVAETPERARSALDGPRALLGDLSADRDIVCGATRAPFAWLDLREVALPGRLADFGGLAFTATFGEGVEMKALGNYYTRERNRIYGECLNRPRVAIRPPPGAVAWHSSFESPTLRWAEVCARLDGEQVRGELDRLATEFLPKGRVETEVIAKLGPEWGAALFDAERAFAFVRVPEGMEPLFRKACADIAKARRDRGLDPFAELDGDRLRLPAMKREGFAVMRGRLLLMATERAMLDDPACLAFADPPAGEWQIGAGFTVVEARRVLESWGAPAAWLDRVAWAASIDARGRYSEAGLTVAGTIR